MTVATRNISVETLARVEGEGGMYVRIRDGHVLDVKVRIYEPPRLFEGFLRGRSFMEAPDITARICGICPVAYQMAAAHAMEDALGLEITPEIHELRRLFYCGEWIESHVLHMFMLHAPDFLGYDDVIQMAVDHPELVRRALEVKKLGNDIMTAIAGREIHPVNARVGGFYRSPRREEISPLRDRLARARDEAIDFLRWTMTMPFPELEVDYDFVALRHPSEYPLNKGRIVSWSGLDIDVSDWEEHFVEDHVKHSNALHARIRGRGSYMVGPMARYALNYDRLPLVAREFAEELGLEAVVRNPFRSICVRGVELLFACDEALRIVDSYVPPEPPYFEAEPHDAIGSAATEAPRGLLYHRYEIDSEGKIVSVRIVPPTSQNLKRMEEDLVRFVQQHPDLDQAEMTLRCEHTIRNYDPCISCATHFLKFELERD